MNGREIARRLTLINPSLAIVYGSTMLSNGGIIIPVRFILKIKREIME
jgi:hypothetical protein